MNAAARKKARPKMARLRSSASASPSTFLRTRTGATKITLLPKRRQEDAVVGESDIVVEARPRWRAKIRPNRAGSAKSRLRKARYRIARTDSRRAASRRTQRKHRRIGSVAASKSWQGRPGEKRSSSKRCLGTSARAMLTRRFSLPRPATASDPAYREYRQCFRACFVRLSSCEASSSMIAIPS